LLSVAPGTSGDYNDDGVVNAADYVMWRKLNGTSTVMPNDPNPVPIDNDQYVTWRGNFGGSDGGAGQDSAVPEPNAVLLFAMCGSLLIGRTRRRRERRSVRGAVINNGVFP
jgi:hypothetical protein